jgi:hypothetical protein
LYLNLYPHYRVKTVMDVEMREGVYDEYHENATYFSTIHIDDGHNDNDDRINLDLSVTHRMNFYIYFIEWLRDILK